MRWLPGEAGPRPSQGSARHMLSYCREESRSRVPGVRLSSCRFQRNAKRSECELFGLIVFTAARAARVSVFSRSPGVCADLCRGLCTAALVSNRRETSLASVISHDQTKSLEDAQIFNAIKLTDTQ